MRTLSVIPCIALSLAVAGTAAGQTSPDPTLPGTPAAMRASEMDLIERGSREDFRGYVQSTYTGDFARMPLDMRINFQR